MDQLSAVVVWVEIELQVWLGHSIPDRLYVTLVAAVLAWGGGGSAPLAAGGGSVVLVIYGGEDAVRPRGRLSNAAGVQVGVILLFYGLGRSRRHDARCGCSRPPS